MRWKELIALPKPPDFIQIISWNDFGESHYIGPEAGTHPEGTTWVLVISFLMILDHTSKSSQNQCLMLLVCIENREGFDHQAWLAMTDYFISWYKHGSPPEIKSDQVYFNYRTHSVHAVACEFQEDTKPTTRQACHRTYVNLLGIQNSASDPLGPPANASTTSDAVYLATFLSRNSAARKISVTIGNQPPQIFKNLPLGDIGTYSAFWKGAGGVVSVSLMDDKDTELLGGKGKHVISNVIDKYNFSKSSSGSVLHSSPPMDFEPRTWYDWSSLVRLCTHNDVHEWYRRNNGTQFYLKLSISIICFVHKSKYCFLPSQKGARLFCDHHKFMFWVVVGTGGLEGEVLMI